MSKTFKSILWILSAGMFIFAGYIQANKPVAKQYDGARARTAQEALVTLVNPVSSDIEVGQTQTVRWSTRNYSAPTVSVRIIRKVASNPDRYEAVRTVAAATKNDGDATWVPAVADAGSNLFIEVGCTLSTTACKSTQPLSKFAVKNTGRFRNTASAFAAIEAANNK